MAEMGSKKMGSKKDMGGFAKGTIFSFIVMGLFIYIAEVVTSISGERTTRAAVAGINPEAGEDIFFGRGKCSTCHSLGERGSAIRCPNLGVKEGEKFPNNLPIMQRAAERAKERTTKTGKTYTPIDYIVESHFDPSAYVVEGFKNEMPIIWQPPIALSADEVMAVDTFLQTQGGEVDVETIAKSPFFSELKKATAGQSAEATTVSFQPYMAGDQERGKGIFFDPESKAPCAKCHTVGGQGGTVGPDLTNVAGTRTILYIIDSVLDPSKEIAGGFEPYLIITQDNEFITGVKKGEDGSAVEILDSSGELRKIQKGDIKKMVQQKASIMPGNFKELLTIEEFHDLLAFLMTLT